MLEIRYSDWLWDAGARGRLLEERADWSGQRYTAPPASNRWKKVRINYFWKVTILHSMHFRVATRLCRYLQKLKNVCNAFFFKLGMDIFTVQVFNLTAVIDHFIQAFPYLLENSHRNKDNFKWTPSSPKQWYSQKLWKKDVLQLVN